MRDECQRGQCTHVRRPVSASEHARPSGQIAGARRTRVFYIVVAVCDREQEQRQEQEQQHKYAIATAIAAAIATVQDIRTTL